MAWNRWSAELFKGRIGEAVVEAVLEEFGYQVQRAGFEQVHSGQNRVAPDLLVTHPKSGMQRYVEVKYRSARPTSVILERRKVAALVGEFPETVLAMASAYDGAIYCSTVENIPLSREPSTVRLNLLDDYWMPIWHFFPLVRPGKRLAQLWKSFRNVLERYGERVVRTQRDQPLWEGEADALKSYILDTWDEEMQSLGIARPEPEKMTLADLWNSVREINAAGLAVQLIDQDPAETLLVQLAHLSPNPPKEGVGSVS